MLIKWFKSLILIITFKSANIGYNEIFRKNN